MSKTVLTDEALRGAAAEVREAMLRSMPAPEECVHEFSAEYEAKTERLIKRVELRESVRRISRSAAAVLLAVMVGLSGWLAVDAEARAELFSWTRELHEDRMIYRYSVGDKALTELPEVELTWLPEGYTEVVRDVDDDECIIVCRNKEGEGFVFLCRLVEPGMHKELLFGDHEYDASEVKINGMDGDLYIVTDGSSSNALVWFDETRGLVYSLNAYLDESVMLHIAKGVELTE